MGDKSEKWIKKGEKHEEGKAQAKFARTWDPKVSIPTLGNNAQSQSLPQRQQTWKCGGSEIQKIEIRNDKKGENKTHKIGPATETRGEGKNLN